MPKARIVKAYAFLAPDSKEKKLKNCPQTRARYETLWTTREVRSVNASAEAFQEFYLMRETFTAGVRGTARAP
jgi:hypothetical protein